MEKQVLNYRIIIKPYKEGKKTMYTAECPTLGVYDWGKSIEEVLKSIQEGIECEIAGRIEDGEEIPIDDIEKEILTSTNVKLPHNASVAFSS